MVAAVFLLHVANDLVAAVLAEIDVEIRHGHAFRVEEPFEQQAETQRIEIGDPQGPGNHRTGAGAAAGADGDAVLLGPADEVGDDQEVTRIAHVDDDLEFVCEALAVGIARLAALFGGHVRL